MAMKKGDLLMSVEKNQKQQEEKNQKQQVAIIKSYIARIDIKKRFEEILGTNANQFMASIVNVVSSNYKLQKCNPNSIMSAAFIAASFNLPIDSNLGFAAIVPYGNKAQFQMMYRGYVQLAIRTGQYKKINATEIYEDELIGYNPIMNEMIFKEFLPNGQREQGKSDKIIGYYSYFELINGFKHELYMTNQQIKNHAERYSKAYQYDLKEKEKLSLWSTDFNVMAIKTPLKLLLSKWGILSIEMQKAITEDQKVYDSTIDQNGNFLDNPEQIETTIEDPFSKEQKNIQQEILEIINNLDQNIIDQAYKEAKLPNKTPDQLTNEECENLRTMLNILIDQNIKD